MWGQGSPGQVQNAVAKIPKTDLAFLLRHK